MMAKFKVFLTGYCCASVEIEADSPEQALEIAYDETDGYAEADFSDWDFDTNEVENEKGETVWVDNAPYVEKGN